MFGLEGFKTKKQREKEKEEYNRKIFPYGEKQSEKLKELVRELFPEEKDSRMAMYNFVISSQRMIEDDIKNLDEEALNEFSRFLKKRIRKKDHDQICRFIALAEADRNIDEELNYPSIEELKNRAEEIRRILN